MTASQASHLLSDPFRALSAALGSDPLQVQGPGGNTSVKDDAVMWIKASGTELADAVTKDIFVAVDRQKAVAEATMGAGDGSCKATVLDTAHGLRPSIETTFHAAIKQPFVVHTHSVATLVHVISPQGRLAAAEKLAGLDFVAVPYAKPGLPLTQEILARITDQTRVILLENHGLICCGATLEEVTATIAEVETRLALAPRDIAVPAPMPTAAPKGFDWSPYAWLAQDARAFDLATSGTYYPDHVVFLGPALPTQDHAAAPPVIVQQGQGVLIRSDATASQTAMLRCLSDVLSRLPADWQVAPIGTAAERELLNWDAEKYRQVLAKQP